MILWIVCSSASHGLPRASPALIVDAPRREDAPGAVIGPFADKEAAKAFAKADPRIWIYFLRGIRRELTTEELSRVISPQDWSAQGQMILGAVWIRPKKSKFGVGVGPFADEAVAMHFASSDPMFGRSVEFELRHGIKPDDLNYVRSPEEWRANLRN